MILRIFRDLMNEHTQVAAGIVEGGAFDRRKTNEAICADRTMKQLRNRYFALGDIVLLIVAGYLSFALHYEHLDLGQDWLTFAIFAALAVLITPFVLWRAGVYSRYWLYASIEEVVLLIGSIACATILVAGLHQAIMGIIISNGFQLPFGFHRPSLSISIVFLLLALAGVTTPRALVRFSSLRIQWGQRTKTTPVIVVGAGKAGAMMVRELQQNPQLNMDVVGFLDDDSSKQNMKIYGVRVLGTHDHIARIARDYRIGMVIIAMPTAPGKVIREIVNKCEQIGIQAKIIPGMYELLDGKVRVSQLRNVEIGDLLRREPVETDSAAVQDLIQGKRVLITGGGGSIGSELCRQVLRSKPEQLIVLGHGENSVFEIENELQRILSLEPDGAETEVIPVICDIRFAARIQTIFTTYQPEIVFHAAAHKHVPLMEKNPAEAITNNVLGTRNILAAAQSVGVEHFVMISSDKAVNPTSVMGASKRAAELLVLQAARVSGRKYVAVRFGNVLGSRGSVILTFQQQILRGGPITVTSPEMTRFFMTIPEAVQLVLQAAVLGKGGEIFLLDMGDPIKITDLACDLIELSGLEVGRDIDIVYTGARPGEKLHEELFVGGEIYDRTYHNKILIARNASTFVPAYLNDMIEQLESAAAENDKERILYRLQMLIPEYRHEVQPVDEEIDPVTPTEVSLEGKRVPG